MSKLPNDSLSNPDRNGRDTPDAPDPFDPASLRISPEGEPGSGVRKLLTQIPVRKPHKQEFFRCHSDPAYRVRMGVLELGADREVYAVIPAIMVVMGQDAKRVEMRVCMSLHGVLFLWHVPLPTEEGRRNAWHETARDAAEQAETKWIRLQPNMNAGQYDILVAEKGGPDPKWPELSFSELLRLAFSKGRLIDTLDHPAMKQLRGEL
jgi:hypothetical protein